MKLRGALAVLALALALLAGSGVAGAATPISTHGRYVAFAFSPSQPVQAFSFHGRAGQKVSVDFRADPGYTLVGIPSLTLQDASGHVIGSGFPGNTLQGPFALPATGSYQFVINGNGSTATGKLALWTYRDRTRHIAVNGRREHVRTRAPYQQVTFLFHGRAGESVGVDLTTRTPRNAGIALVDLLPAATLTAPDGTVLPLTGNYVLPITGTYALKVSPLGIADFNLRMVSPPDHPDRTVAINGPLGYLPITDPNQAATVTFSGKAGQKVSLRISLNDIKFVGGGGQGTPTLYVIEPHGNTILTGPYLNTGGPLTLPSTGTYTIKVDPAGYGTGTISLRLSTS